MLQETIAALAGNVQQRRYRPFVADAAERFCRDPALMRRTVAHDAEQIGIDGSAVAPQADRMQGKRANFGEFALQCAAYLASRDGSGYARRHHHSTAIVPKCSEQLDEDALPRQFLDGAPPHRRPRIGPQPRSLDAPSPGIRWDAPTARVVD